MAILKSRLRLPRPAVLAISTFTAGLLIFGLLLAPAAGAQAKPEYQLKAVFLFRFAQFVEWPQQAFADTQSPLTICVLGDDPFDGYLDETVKGEHLNDHPFLVRRAHRLEDIGTCHILFISASEGVHLKSDLAAIKGQSVLTVGDSDDFGRTGGMIGFALDEDKVRLLINPEAAKAANLKISSKLLQAAQIVGDGS